MVAGPNLTIHVLPTTLSCNKSDGEEEGDGLNRLGGQVFLVSGVSVLEGELKGMWFEKQI